MVTPWEAFERQLLPEIERLKRSKDAADRARLRDLEVIAKALRKADRDDIDSGRITSRKYRAGYAERRGDFARFRCKGESFAPGIPWRREQEARIRAELEGWLDSLYGGAGLAPETAAVDVPPDLRTATRAYLEAVDAAESAYAAGGHLDREIPHRKASSVSSILSAAKHLLLFPVPMDADQIREWIEQRITAPSTLTGKPLAVATVRIYTEHARIAFQWMIARGWLSTNPVVPVAKRVLRAHTKLRNESDVVVYEIGELEQAISDAYQMLDPEYGLFYELLWVTGMRADIEALGLWWRQGPERSYITPTSIEIFGKGRNRRSFPIIPERQLGPNDDPVSRWQRRLQRIVTDLRDLDATSPRFRSRPLPTDAEGRRLRVFRWTNLHVLQCQWRKVLDKRKAYSDRKLLHAIRRTTRGYFEHDLQLDATTIASLLGHSIAVSEAHYRRRPTAAMTARRLLGGRSADNGVDENEANP